MEEFLFEDQDEGGKTKHITAYRIRFASGFQVCALSSRPANIRGLQGHVVIDEAAFHPDVQGVLDAATALLIWGGQITIISSHNGKNNPFAQLCRDIEAGRYGADAAVVTVTFDDAVTNGLYERVCFMKARRPRPRAKRVVQQDPQCLWGAQGGHARGTRCHPARRQRRQPAWRLDRNAMAEAAGRAPGA